MELTMALSRNPAASPAPTPAPAPAASGPSFESMEETNAGADTATEEAPAPAAAPAPATAVATRATGGLSIASNTTIKMLKNQIPQEELEALSFGVFPRITCAPGSFMMDKTTPLGDKLELALMSWNEVWIVTTGEQNNPEANKLVRTSFDGVNLKDNNGTIAEYLAWLKNPEQGYDKAECKRYVELYGVLLFTGKHGAVAEDDQKLVQVSLSPQSVGQWGRFQLESAMRKGAGKDDSNVIVIEAHSKTIGPNSFGIQHFSPKKSA